MSTLSTPTGFRSVPPSQRDIPLIPKIDRSGLKAGRLPESPLSYHIANQKDDLSEAFGLVYESYLRTGLAEPNETGIRLTPYHLLPTTDVFVTRFKEEVVSTVSLIGDGYLGLPMQSIYPQEINKIRGDGLRMAEIGCLADRRESPVRFIETFANMGRMLAQHAKQHGYDGLVAATHPKHARLYRRILPFQQAGDQSECPYANGNPAVMLSLVFDDHKGTALYERFFGSDSNDVDVTPSPWTNSAREYFKGFLQSEAEKKGGRVQGCLAYSALTGKYPSRAG